MSLALIAKSYIAKVDNEELETVKGESGRSEDERSKAKENDKLNVGNKLNETFQRRRSKRKRGESPVKESVLEDKIGGDRLCPDLQESNAAGGGGERRSSRKKSRSGENDVGDKNVIVDLDQTWPFTHFKIVLQKEDDVDDVGEGESSGKMESGWDLEGSKFVFYDRVTSSEVKQMRDELENSARTKSSMYFHLTAEPVPIPELLHYGAGNRKHQELENSELSSSKQRTTKQKQMPVRPPHKRSCSGARRKSRQSVEISSDLNDNFPPPTVTQTENGSAEKVLKIEAVFKCPYCLVIFPEAVVMIQHLEAQSCQKKTDEVSNDKCNEKILKSNSTKMGTPSKPTVQPKEKGSNPLNGETRQDQSGKCSRLCVICGESFGRIYELDHHMNLHSGETPFKCPLCSEGFPDLSSIDKHVRELHETGKEISLLELLERSKSRKTCETGKSSPSSNEDLPQLDSRLRTRISRKVSE